MTVMGERETKMKFGLIPLRVVATGFAALYAMTFYYGVVTAALGG